MESAPMINHAEFFEVATELAKKIF